MLLLLFWFFLHCLVSLLKPLSRFIFIVNICFTRSACMFESGVWNQEKCMKSTQKHGIRTNSRTFDLQWAFCFIILFFNMLHYYVTTLKEVLYSVKWINSPTDTVTYCWPDCLSLKAKRKPSRLSNILVLFLSCGIRSVWWLARPPSAPAPPPRRPPTRWRAEWPPVWSAASSLS